MELSQAEDCPPVRSSSEMFFTIADLTRKNLETLPSGLGLPDHNIRRLGKVTNAKGLQQQRPHK